jgi:exodeoxyribonuclease VII small subunit
MSNETTFREAYETLQRHAETLRSQREPDLDNLLQVVTESVAAYKVCKFRIDAVEKALEDALSGAGLDPNPLSPESGAGAGASDSSHRPAPAKAAFRPGDDEEDIPF